MIKTNFEIMDRPLIVKKWCDILLDLNLKQKLPFAPNLMSIGINIGIC